MTSPSARLSARRRQRSTRLVVAGALLLTAAVLVLGSIATGQSTLVLLSALASLVLGSAATRITYSELLQTRRDAAEDRTRQAQAYRDITERRTLENIAFAEEMRSRMIEREETIDHLEVELAKALERAATATAKVGAEARRADLAEVEGLRLSEVLEDSESRAAEAIVRVAELEAEIDALRAELDAWQVAANQAVSKPA